MADLLYDVVKQIRAIEQMDPFRTFLTDTFTIDEGAFLAEDILMDYRKGDEIVAPFVVPHGGGKVVQRNVFDTRSVAFPSIAPELVLDWLDYNTRSFGEDILGSMSPEQRMLKRMAEDFSILLRRIQNRREWMVAQMLFTGKLDLIEYVNEGDTVKATKYADFGFDQFFSPVNKWGQPGANIDDDCMRMIDVVCEGNGNVEIAIMDNNTRSAMMGDENWMKKLDVRNVNVGEMAPGMPKDGLQYIGTYLKGGVDLFAYTGSYREKPKGPKHFYVPKGKILFGGRKMLRLVHGPVVQVEKDGENPKIYAKKEVPFRHSSAGGTSVKQRMTSRPMLIPENINGWVVGNVMS